MQSHNPFIDLAEKAEGFEPMKEVFEKKFVNSALIRKMLLIASAINVIADTLFETGPPTIGARSLSSNR